MLENTRPTTTTWIAAGAGILGCLGLAVVLGLVPRPAGTARLSADVAGPTAPQPLGSTTPTTAATKPGLPAVAGATSGATAPAKVAPGTTTAPRPVVTAPAVQVRAVTVATTAPATAPPATAPPTGAAPVQHPSPVVVAPHVTVPPAPAIAPRQQPSSTAVTQAIAGLKPYLHSFLSPSPAQVAQLGNDVCTAFDQGQTFSQVTTTVSQQVSQIPATTLAPGGAQYIVRTAVSLYCPGYSSKLA